MGQMWYFGLISAPDFPAQAETGNSTRMTRTILALAALAFGVFLPVLATAAPERGTREDAQALVAKAVAAFNEKGSGVFEEINSGGFRDRDLYIFAYSTGPDAKLVAYGGPPVDPPVLGRPAAEVIGLGGLPIGKMFVERATPQGTWVDYRWYDPATGETADKSSWVVRVRDHIFGCGVNKVPN
jgi:cytochrome c